MQEIATGSSYLTLHSFAQQTTPYVFVIDLNSDIHLNTIRAILTKEWQFSYLQKHKWNQHKRNLCSRACPQTCNNVNYDQMSVIIYKCQILKASLTLNMYVITQPWLLGAKVGQILQVEMGLEEAVDRGTGAKRNGTCCREILRPKKATVYVCRGLSPPRQRTRPAGQLQELAIDEFQRTQWGQQFCLANSNPGFVLWWFQRVICVERWDSILITHPFGTLQV